MGEQTGVVIVGFVVIHIALILSVISLSTPVWIKATENSTNSTNSTQSDDNVTTKGLWQMCEFGECTKLNQTEQTGSFRASRALFTVGSALLFGGTLGMYCYLAFQALRTNKKVSILSALNIFVAGGCLLSAIVIFGVKTLDETSDLGADLILNLGWSYYSGVAATVFTFLSVCAAVHRTRVIIGRSTGYEDI